MAYIKLYSYTEGDTLNTTLLSSEKIYIGEVSVPEISMSSISYFSVEGRSLTISFWSEDETILDMLTINKGNHISSKYIEVLNVFAEVYNDDDEKMFSGVLNSKFEYDDYDSTFSNVVIMDGLHCLIKYHLDGLETETQEPYYFNNFPDDEDKDSFGQEIDIEGLPLSKMNSAKPLRRYFYIYNNGINFQNLMTKDKIVELLSFDTYNYYFPMRINNSNLDDIDFDESSLTNVWSPIKRSGLTLGSVANEYYANSKEYFPIDDSGTSAFSNNRQFRNNWDYSLEPKYLANGEVNPKFYLMRTDAWFSFKTASRADGTTRLFNYNFTDDYTVIDQWFVYVNREIIPKAMSDSQNRDYAYYTNKIEIRKFRFVFDRANHKFWFDDVYDYSSSWQEELYYYYYDGSPMGEADKIILSERLVKGEYLGYETSIIMRTGIPRLCLYSSFIKPYLGALANKYWNDLLTEGFLEDNIFQGFWVDSDGLNLGASEGTKQLIFSWESSKQSFRVEGDVKLTPRALAFATMSNISDFLKAVLLIHNLSMIGDINGNITFIKKIRSTLPLTATYHYLDDSNTRSMITGDNLESIDETVFDSYWHSTIIKWIVTTQYSNIFGSFPQERQFTSMRFAFYTEPTINDVIVFRNKNYWINSIKLSNDYQSYIIKAYEVI